MSISKLRGKSALGGYHENAQTTKGTAATTTQQHGAGKTGGSGCATAATTATAPTTITTTTGTPTEKVEKTLNSCNSPVPSAAACQQQQQTILPQTSLLKIEPFVPSFNTRLRRPIGRSYSTLSTNSTTYLKRAPGVGGPSGLGSPKQAVESRIASNSLVVGAAIDSSNGGLLPKPVRPTGHLRRHPLRVVARQRSKSTSSSASNRPATAAANNKLAANATTATATATATTNGGAIVTPQPNGVCRITRLSKEQEKLPDRINYDRRGLTAIPLFENEPNLRLLSLQHNLINIFHIPKEEPLVVQDVDRMDDGTSPTQPATRLSRQITSKHSRLTHGSSRLSLTLTSPNTHGGSHSPTPPPPPLTTHPLSIGGNNGVHVNQLMLRNGLLQKNFNCNALPLPLPISQQSTQFRLALKKSKSFVTNYSRHLSNMKRNLQKSVLTRTEANMLAALNGASNLKSFDSGASGLTTDSASTVVTSEMEEDDHVHQLEIKNKQLRTSYGMVFQNLVFLDLYDNQIERIANLDGLPTLSVLLLGKNRITDISGLASLHNTLRVLDLHGNKITSISNKINCLQELKSLNLAGNQIRQINQNDFNGLLNLKELNLKRNKIKRINGFQHLTVLERLWLCHNDLHKVEDMSSIAKAINLLEVTIENNPVSLAGDCVSFLVSYLPRLQSLSQMPITDQVRRAAMAWRKNKELSDANYTHLSSDVFNSIRREEVISNARTNWELLRSQQTVQATLRQQRSPKQRELAKINESNEAVVGYDELQELIKLPPIQRQHQPTPTDEATPETNGRQRSGSSASSLSPNIDSSSSCYSSDNEESPKIAVERARVKKCQRGVTMRGRSIDTKEKASHLQSKNQQQPQDPKVTYATSPAEQPAKDGKRDAVTIITTPPDNGDASTNTATAADGAPTDAALNSNQADNNSSIAGISNASITMVPQTGSAQRAASATKSTAITASNLGFNAAASATATTCKRYTPGTLMRSQTIVGSSAASALSSNGCGARVHSSQAVTSRANIAGSQPIPPQPNTTSTGQAAAAVAVSSVATASTSASASTLSSASKPTATASTAASSAASMGAGLGAAFTAKPVTANEREREQGGDYLIEICGRYLNIYGQGALRFIDKQWNPTKANDVHTLNFSYINFNNVTAVLARIKVRFPHAENFVFRETNISCLGQLNALAELQGVVSLFIDPEGNPITTKDLWRQYAIYRLSHWGLKLLNGVDVCEAEVDEANALYSGLSDLVLWSMPDVMLQPLLARLRLDETCTASKMSPKEWLMKADNKSLRLVVGKEALQWKKSNGNASNNFNGQQQPQYHLSSSATTGAAASPSTQAQSPNTAALNTRERGRLHFALMMENTCNAVEKLHKLDTLWPSLLLDIVRNTLLDYSQLNTYLRNLMNEIIK